METKCPMPVLIALLTMSLTAGACAGPPDTAVAEAEDDLEELRALWFGDPVVPREEDESEVWSRREDAIRECMDTRGQAYVPRPLPRNPIVEQLREEQRALEGTRAYAERYGFGMTTIMAADEVATAYESRFPYQDPNHERLEALPWAERLPFLEALLGPPAEHIHTSLDGVPFDSYETTDPSQGCAVQAAGGGLGPVRLPAAAYEELEGIEGRIAADPGLLEVTREWAACMQRSGYTFTRREEALLYTSEQAGGEIDIVGETTVEVEGPSGERVALSVVQYDDAQLEAAIATEIAVATADFDCLEESGYLPVEREVRREAQLAWVERWATALTDDVG